MKKTIVVISVIMLIACILFTACKTKAGTPSSSTSAESKQAEIVPSTDKDTGELFVTNTEGDRIPVTTSVDGAMDLTEELITKTLEQVSKEAEEISRTKENSTTAPAGPVNEPTTAPASPVTTTSPVADTTTQPSSGIEVGTDNIFDDGNAAVIDWGN